MMEDHVTPYGCLVQLNLLDTAGIRKVILSGKQAVINYFMLVSI